MWINSLLRAELIDPVMGVSNNRNAGLTQDADLTLLVVNTGISVRMRSCSDPHLKSDAGFLRPATEVEHRVAQTCARNEQGCSEPRWMGHRVPQTRI